jgi:outer membrane lipoprotein SlyB
MLKVLCRVFCLAALTLAALGCVASAQDTVRIRGTIEKVDGAVYVVKSRDGPELKVSLTDNPLIVAIVKASLSDVKQGSFIGATGMPQPDGSQKAIEVHIFPESMRGTGEGHYAWDLQPQSTMTNANVERAVAGVDGQTLTVKHKNGENKVVVTPQTAIVTYVPGDKSEIKPGTKILHCRGEKAAGQRLADAAHQLRQRRTDAADVKTDPDDQPSGGSASTTEVSICRSGIVQYILSNAALRSGETSAKPWR